MNSWWTSVSTPAEKPCGRAATNYRHGTVAACKPISASSASRWWCWFFSWFGGASHEHFALADHPDPCSAVRRHHRCRAGRGTKAARARADPGFQPRGVDGGAVPLETFLCRLTSEERRVG